VWFVWVLLAFDCIAAGLLLLSSKWGERLSCALAAPSKRPIVFFMVLTAVSAGVYLPLVMKFGPMDWSSFGPFFFQTSRILHYLVYFLVGAGLGAYGLHRGLLVPDGKLARRWYLWVIASFVTFAMAIGVFIASLASPNSAQLLNFIGGIVFALACAAACFAFLAMFIRFTKKEGIMMNSLRDNAYGMYVIHYAFVSWLQYALLKSQLSGFTKGMLVTAGTVALSWMTVGMLRRIPVVARVL
jgi:surface polysaccharide O-acyltransferase-like enzyme